MRKVYNIFFVLIFVFSQCKETPSTAPGMAAPLDQGKVKASAPSFDYSLIRGSLDTILTAIHERNLKAIAPFCLDSINTCNKRQTLAHFIDRCGDEVVNSRLLTRIKDSTNVTTINCEVISSYYSDSFLSHLKSFGKTFYIRRIQVDLLDTEPYVIAFDFIDTKKGFKLISCDVYGGPDCCR